MRRGGEIPSGWALHPDLGLQAFGPVRQHVSAVGSSGLWGSVFVTLLLWRQTHSPSHKSAVTFLTKTVSGEAHDQTENLDRNGV